MALAYELAEQGAMSEQDDSHWHKNYLKQLRDALMPTESEQINARSTSPLAHATPQFRRENEEPPAASSESDPRATGQVERKDLDGAAVSIGFPTLAAFRRHPLRYHSDSRSAFHWNPTRDADATEHQQKAQQPQEVTTSPSTITPVVEEPIEQEVKTYGQCAAVMAHSARMQLLRHKPKRANSELSKHSAGSGANEKRKSLKQLLEDEVFEEQIETILQQELE